MLDHDLQETAMTDSARAALDRLLQSIPQVVADLRALRAEVRARTMREPGQPQWRGADPLAAVCNDLALAIMLAGGLPISIPPQNSGRDPDPDKLAADWERWQASLAPRESSGAPFVIQHAGARY